MQDLNADINSMNAEKLKKIFHIDDLDEYQEFIPLADRQAGFSVKREYPSNIRYNPPRTHNGKLDVVAIIRVVYVSPKETKKKIEGSKVPIFLLISPFSRYLSNHFDYNFNDIDCPTEESIQNSKSTPTPIALQSFDEYVYDHASNTLQTTKGKKMSGEQILDTVFKEHSNTIHLFRGLKFRLKRDLRNLLIKTCGLGIRILNRILKTFFGRTLESSESSRGILEPFKKEDLKLLKTESIDLFGYKASKNVIVVFSMFIIVIYTVAYKCDIRFLSNMTSNSLMAVCFAIVLLWIFDHPIPYVILFFLNLIIQLRLRLLLTRVRI